MSRYLLRSCAAGALLVAVMAYGMDPPHDGVAVSGLSSPVGCTSCHVAHNALGATLTSDRSQSNLCNSCHATSTSGAGSFGFPWTSTAQAIPGAGGDHHRWDANAVNPDHDATVPDPTSTTSTTLSSMLSGMKARIDRNGGKISCSVCHDQHDGVVTSSASGAADGYASAGTPHLSCSTGGGCGPTTGTGSGTVLASLAIAGSTPPQKSYTIQIAGPGAVGTAAAAGTATFQVSYDNGYSYYALQTTSTAATALNADVNVKVAFNGSFTVGNVYSFYLSYPMLRYPNQISNVGSQLCLACHPARAQSALRARGEDASYPANGANVFSHPVGVTAKFGNNPYSADDWGNACSTPGACQNVILDPNGAHQGASTAPSQLIDLDAGGNVHCMSCHYPHNADSSSLSANPR